ncbi:hypothetical protein D6833_06310 [Candidatus Parcubacteria bacterium]|nr:MAG: hypothetical protein D6833_06310 [Candidatus Parcubacteria bacterium]
MGNDFMDITKLVFILLLPYSINIAYGSKEDHVKGEHGSFPLSVEGGPRRTAPLSIPWNGKEYEVESGINLLMNIIRDKTTPSAERHLALVHLTMAGRRLKGHACLEELKRIYESATVQERRVIVDCFSVSHDPRAIPFLYNVLENTKSIDLRLGAAVGLAGWNVRRGVAVLIDLLDSPAKISNSSIFRYVRDYAMYYFRMLNIRKGWGFVDNKESVEWPPDMKPTPDVARRMGAMPTSADIKIWWIENKERFPDWKPGDPLPEIRKKE